MFTRQSDPKVPAMDITAIVTVTDDGGSSGRLRREFDIMPPGDIRNCMVALSEDSGLLSRLFQYRFSAGRGLKGHSFGNLFLMALTQIMGDFPEAVRVSSEVLKIAGRIYPSTTANVALEATLADGTKVVGETRISRSRQPIKRVQLIPRKAPPLAAALAAIDEADVITLGPGSLFTSVVPNLLVERRRRRYSAIQCGARLLRQPDVATRRDHRFPGVRPHSRPASSCRQKIRGLRSGEHPAHHFRRQEALRAGASQTYRRRHRRHFGNGSQGNRRKSGASRGKSAA